MQVRIFGETNIFSYRSSLINLTERGLFCKRNGQKFSLQTENYSDFNTHAGHTVHKFTVLLHWPITKIPRK